MKEFEKLKIVVDDGRAVKAATIVIGDIAVLSGVNASGKSTIAHLVHSLVNLNREYKKFVLETVWRQLRRVNWRVRRFRGRLSDAMDDDVNQRFVYSDHGSVLRGDDDTFEKRAELLYDEWSRALQGYYSLREQDQAKADRLFGSFVTEMGLPENVAGIEDVQNWLEHMVYEAEGEQRRLLRDRRSSVWGVADSEARRWIQYPGHVQMFEGDVSVYDSDKKDGEISEILNIDHAFYIESPWRNLPNLNRDGSLSINDGFDFFAPQDDFTPDETLFAALGGHVVDSRDKEIGTVVPRFPDGIPMWMFKRTDGRGEYPLDECATGMKAFSILNFLYGRGLLNNRTLLVVDEPEAHLHPQWILEYAKVLVRLNRNLGVRLLLTTHSPDMLNAIRRVANVEEVPDLRFYLAKNEDVSKSLQYEYESLGRNVEPIFAAFNIEADRTEAYPYDAR